MMWAGIIRPFRLMRRSMVLFSMPIFLAMFAVLALAAGAPAASASPLPASCGSSGSGAGQLREPSGVAVSQATGDVYVLDRENNRVDEFTGECVFIRAFGWDVNAEKPEEAAQTCTTATRCQAGTSGAGAGQLDAPFLLGGIAVDNCENLGVPCSPLADPSVGDVYVVDAANTRVEKFTAEGGFLLQFSAGGGSVAVGPTGTVYVGEGGAAQEYDPETGVAEAKLELEGAISITDLAINAASELYVTEGQIFEGQGETHPVRHYSATGTLLGVFDEESNGSAHALALNGAGDVYISQRLSTSPEPLQIREFTPAGVQVAAFATTSSTAREGLAFSEQTGALYTPKLNNNEVEVIVPPGPGPVVSGESASGVEPTAAVVGAVVNPDAPVSCGETHYRVEYATAKEFEETGKYGKAAPASEGVLPRSFEEDPVEVPLSGLSTRTGYHYRFVASDECEETVGVETKYTTDGADETFTTQPPALIEAEWASDVRSTSVTLHAAINPFGVATEYRFVYGPCAGGGECSVPIPAEQLGSAKTDVEQHVQGLTAGQAYHYRVITTNTIAGMHETEEGEERSFTTPTGGEVGLPDSRQWELVSPPDKHGASLLGTNAKQFVQAAGGGGGIAYVATAPTERQPQGNGAVMQILARRGGSGWSSLDLEAPHTFPVGVTLQVPYVAFSPDLGQAVLQPLGSFEPALSTEATEQTAYLRDTTTGLFTPLVTPADDTTEPLVPFGEEAGEGQCNDVVCGPAFRGVSPDLSHVVLGPGRNGRVASLLQGTPAGSLYEWAGGKLALVSELPAKKPPQTNGEPTLGGFIGTVTAHAVSSDGSRVFWSDNEAPSGGPLLFMRDMTLKETIEIGSGPVNFEGANAAGTLVFYNGTECEVLVGGAGLECRAVTGDGEDGTVLASSEDGAWVYFRQGESIYVRHGSEAARLVAAGIGNIRPSAVVPALEPQEDPWRASPDGEWFSFMSDSPLTGYDNRDAFTGRPDEEVYLYSVAAGRLVCASCDPTGQRPQGSTALNFAVYGSEGWQQQPLAGTIPAWAPYTPTHAVYDPRFLSDSGRLFFNAVGGLVPRDVNGQVDVYELEPPGLGSCTTSTQTGTVVYVPAAAGCVALISSGESGEESVFEDASESGEDVFFLSSSRLSTADLDGTLSLWDAHACTTASPCVAAPASPPPPCNTESSCKASQSSQPQIYGAPPTATFSGPGNLPPAPPPSAHPKTAAQIKAEKLGKALKACHTKHNRQRRQTCERQARKRYGPTKAKKASHTTTTTHKGGK